MHTALACTHIHKLQVKEMMTDRDPDGGGRFPSVTAMREAKLRDWLSVAQVSREEHPHSSTNTSVDMLIYRLDDKIGYPCYEPGKYLAWRKMLSLIAQGHRAP